MELHAMDGLRSEVSILKFLAMWKLKLQMGLELPGAVPGVSLSCEAAATQQASGLRVGHGD